MMIEGTDPIHVLIVEDDDAHAELIQIAMSAARIQNPLVRACNGERAMEMLRERADGSGDPQFGLIMLDLKLPGMSGVDVLHEVREDPRLRYIPVVVLTTSVNDRDRIAAYNDHVNSYVRKPLDFDEFQVVVRDLGYYWCIHNTPRS